jgi:hypothetical protein
MEPDAYCTCGHVYNEHRQDANGPHECEIVDCDCAMFEADD